MRPNDAEKLASVLRRYHAESVVVGNDARRYELVADWNELEDWLMGFGIARFVNLEAAIRDKYPDLYDEYLMIKDYLLANQ